MMPGINPSYADVSLLNNMLKNITNAQSDLSDRLIKVAVTQQVEAASLAGLGEAIDEYA